MQKEKTRSITITFYYRLLPIIIAALLTACGAGGGGSNTGSNSTNNVSNGIGSNGGTVASSDGKVKVVIPVGALTQATDITISAVSKPPAGNVGAAYDFGPAGTIFSKPVTISITYDKTALPSGVNESDLKIGTINNNDQWEIVADSSVDTTAKVVSSPTTHFSTYGVIYIGNAEIHPGSMLTARNGHTATLLSNGKVLITGGDDSNWNTASSAEMYDPATGIFKAIGNMSTHRDSHTATLLPSGKVLITGGFDNSGNTLSSMEQYDPATDTFTDTGSMTTARYLHTATLLSSGKILIAGGYDEDDNPLSSAELYDPATDTFTPTSRMAPARAGHTATLLSNGKVLIAGGWNDSKNSAFASAELYDPAKGTFTSIGNMLIARDGHTSTLLPDGKVLIAGGGDSEDAYASAEVYDPATNTFTVTGSMTTSRGSHTATLLSNGNILILGGYNSKSDAFSSAELYDSSSGKFTAINSMVSVSITPESASVATGGTQTFTAKVTGSSNTGVTWSVKEGASGGTITDGGVYTAPLTGGTYHIIATSQADPNKIATAAIDVTEVTVKISPASASVVKGGSQGFSATVTGSSNTKVTWSIKEGITGGTIVNTTTGVVYTAPMTTGTYHVVATSQADPSKSAEAAIDVVAVLVSVDINPKSASVAIGGSQTFSATVTGTTNTNVTWSVKEGASGGVITSGGVYTAPLTSGTYHVIATSQADSSKSATAKIYVSMHNMTTARAGHIATLLFNGKVLIAGGYGVNDKAINSADMYDPATGTFMATGSTTTPYAETATLLPNGKVLIAGGWDRENDNPSAELYDLVTGTFTVAGSMTTTREGYTATLLPNGKVLIAGGWGNENDNSSVELYDPATGTFTVTGNMTTTRAYHATTLLSNGKVLISGGYDDGSKYTTLNSAELYDPATGIFTITGSMTNPRTSHTTIPLSNGKVLIVGGYDDDGHNDLALNSLELYDPATGTFTATSSMTITREGYTATLLPNGKVLIAGGEDGANDNALNSAELYDTATGTFTVTGSMTTGRKYHTATLLSNGKVLIAGGESNYHDVQSSIELYDPATGTFE